LSLFQKSVLNSIKQDESLVATRWAAFQNYIAKIDAIRGFKEEVYQDGFFKDIFESCLGYTLKTTNPSGYNLEREKKNETDGKKADGVIYVNGEIIGVVELKDQKTKNLDAVSLRRSTTTPLILTPNTSLSATLTNCAFTSTKKRRMKNLVFLASRMRILKRFISSSVMRASGITHR